MKGLTKRQKDVLEYIQQFLDINKYPPTIREIADKFSFSVKAGYDHLRALSKKNYIKCTGHRSRAIEIIEQKTDENIVKVPVLGAVAAGKPLFATENFENMVGVPTELLRKGKHFALNVRGDSMQDAGIMDGDLAIINHRNVAENGDIVVAVLDDAVTLKRFFKEKNRVMLKSENKAYPPIYSREIKILGRLACIIRQYE